MSATMDISKAGGVVTARRRRSIPGRRVAVAGAAVALVVFAGAAWSAWSYFDSINHLSRGGSPGAVEYRTNPGRVVVYYEGHADPSLAELEIQVGGPGGTPVRVEPFPYDLRYDVGKVVGHAVAVFDAPTVGTYVVTSRIEEGAGRLAVGADLGTASVLMVFAVIAALFTVALGVIVAVLLALFGAGNRRGGLAAPSLPAAPHKGGE